MPFCAFHTEQRGGVKMQQRRAVCKGLECELPWPWHARRRQVQVLSLVELIGWFWQDDCITLIHYTYLLCDRSISKASETLTHSPVVANCSKLLFNTQRGQLRRWDKAISVHTEPRQRENKTQRLIEPPRIWHSKGKVVSQCCFLKCGNDNHSFFGFPFK